MNDQIRDFLERLASKAPVPGGGGAAALMGSISAALVSMVANLTTGKKKYEAYQADIERILEEIPKRIDGLYSYIEKDARAFEPLARAYGIPKEQPDRDAILQKALKEAAIVPMEMAEELYGLIPILEELSEKGSRLAISDVAVAAAACRAALESAVMNVYINTAMLEDKALAEEMNRKALDLSRGGAARCQTVYERIVEEVVCRN